MSGPKDADWYLSEEMQLRREEERRRRLEIEGVFNLINSKKNNIKNNFNNFKSCDINFDENLKGYEFCNDLYLEKESIIKETFDNFNDLINKDLKKSIRENSLDIHENKVEILKNYINELNIYDEVVIKNTSTIKNINNKIHSRVVNYKSSGILNEINEDIFKFDFKQDKVLKDNIVDEYNVVIKEFKEMYEKYNNKYILSKELLTLKNDEVEELIKDKELSINYKINQTKEYIKEVYRIEPKLIKEESLNKSNELQYETKYSLYEALCEKLNIEKSLEKSKEISQINKDLSLIDEEVNRLENLLKEKEDYDYIVDSINEVMKELGYDIISSDIMRKVNRTIVDNIYKFDDKNVLNVFTSDTGTIMFEVTGISNEKKEISSLDKLKIKESMNDFCSKYSVIKEKLAEKGILFGKENLKPAEEKYARIRVVNEEKYKVSNKSNVKSKSYQSKYLN